MEGKEEARVKARSRLAATLEEHLPETFTSLSTALLIWLFGVLVYLPTALRIDPVGLPILCSLTVLVGFSVFLLRSVRGLRELLEAVSDVLAYEWLQRRRVKERATEAPLGQTRNWIRWISYTTATIIVYALYSPLIAAINPSLNGLVLTLTILWILWTLLKFLAAT